MVAHGIHETGRREILSIDVGEAETEAFWTEFLRGSVKRLSPRLNLAAKYDVRGVAPNQRTLLFT